MKLLLCALIISLVIFASATGRSHKNHPSQSHHTDSSVKKTRSRQVPHEKKHVHKEHPHHKISTHKQHVHKKIQQRKPQRVHSHRVVYKKITSRKPSSRQQLHFKTFSPNSRKFNCIHKCIQDHRHAKMDLYKLNFICYKACGIAMVDLKTLCLHYPSMCKRLSQNPVHQTSHVKREKEYHLSFPFHFYYQPNAPVENRYVNHIKYREEQVGHSGHSQ